MSTATKAAQEIFTTDPGDVPTIAYIIERETGIRQLLEALELSRVFCYRSLGEARTTETRSLGFACRICGAATHDWRKGTPYHQEGCNVARIESAIKKARGGQ